jgi:hypothetical protein
MLADINILRYCRHYIAKNGYLPIRGMLASDDKLASLIAKGWLSEVPAYEGGPKIYIALTEKGRRKLDQHC